MSFIPAIARAMALVLSAFASSSAAQTYRIGAIWAGGERDGPSRHFVSQLRALGYEEGRNLVIESWYANWDPSRFPQLAKEAVQRKPDLVFAPTNGGALAAKNATRTIPVIFAIVPDPVAQGLVASLARPGGNITGTTNVQTGLTPKRIQLLREIIPSVSRIGVIYDASDKVAADQAEEARKAAAELKVVLVFYEANALAHFRGAFDKLANERVQAVLVTGSLASYNMARSIAELAIERRLPTMTADRKYAEEGALASYGVNISALYAKAATYVDRVLKGAKPADLPVEQADNFELVLNVKSAKLLGIAIPHSVAVRAEAIMR